MRQVWGDNYYKYDLLDLLVWERRQTYNKRYLFHIIIVPSTNSTTLQLDEIITGFTAKEYEDAQRDGTGGGSGRYIASSLKNKRYTACAFALHRASGTSTADHARAVSPYLMYPSACTPDVQTSSHHSRLLSASQRTFFMRQLRAADAPTAIRLAGDP